ncbi:hypothetical protein CSX04_05897 [Burkholderia cepacia]|nr:hypothetical protein CSX04_05897 [Burkholderia cepacia]
MNMNEVAQAIRGGLIQQDRLLKTSIPRCRKMRWCHDEP